MAAVYEASNVDIGKRVAIKLLAGHLATSQTVVERFLREARAVAKIRSPHICDVYDAGRLEDDTPFLVLELLEGESLYDAMVRDRQMSPPLTLAIILQVCRGLAKAHETAIVHRDLKPENIFLTVDDDSNLLVKILDFGLAKFYDPVDSKGKNARLTREGAVFGTPAYMSPEQVRGQAAADSRADLWALACITYECFTGTTVWKTDDGVAMTFAQIATSPLPDPREYRPDLPLSFNAWFARALDRNIDARYQTVRDFADGLIEAFDYSAKGGGLDVSLIHRITNEAAGGGADPEAVTQRHSSGGASPAPTPRPLPSPEVTQPSGSPVALQADDDVLMDIDRMRSGRPGPKAIGAVLAAIGLLLVVVLWINSGSSEPLPEVKRFGNIASNLARAKPLAESGFRFVAKHAWLPRIREAQVHIGRGEHKRALTIVRRVYERSRHGMARNLMDQLQIAIKSKSDPKRCQISGLARPRRYDLLDQSRKPVAAEPPTIVRGISGALLSWADRREGKQHAYAVPLDEALRNRTLPIDIAPEGFRVRTPVLLPVAQRFLAGYWDSSGGSPGTYLRWLSSTGVIAGPPLLVSERKPGGYFADFARGSAGGFVVAWAAQQEADSVDLFFRRFDKKAQPVASIVRATDYLNRGPNRSGVRSVRVQVVGDTMHFAYNFVRGALSQIRYQAIALSTPPPGVKGRQPGKVPEESTLAQEVLITPKSVKALLPTLGCVSSGCFIAWQQGGQGGTLVGFVDRKSGKLQWHKTFSPTGKSPAIGVAPNGDLRLIWVEGRRLVTATLGRQGVGARSTVARVIGGHAPLSIAPGAKRGEWYIAWLDYESGQLEPYAARIQCL